MSKIDIRYQYLIFSTIFGVFAFIHRQSLSSNFTNNIVYRIEKYADFLYTNVTSSLVFRILLLKYIIIFALLSISPFLLLSLSLFFFFFWTHLLFVFHIHFLDGFKWKVEEGVHIVEGWWNQNCIFQKLETLFLIFLLLNHRNQKLYFLF